MRNSFYVLLAVLLFSADFPAVAGSQSYPNGKIIDTVKCDANPHFSYSLYIPSNYNERSRWPVIFVFDPAARSRPAVQRFVAAAEKCGYIIACSSNSRNGLPWNEILDAADFMIGDVKKKFSVNTSRIYTAGFSGGARVASALALLNRGISGVIACGAGFPGMPSNGPIPSFDLIGLVGRTDMNYLEMCDLESDLDKLGRNVELRIFDGGHKWPEEDILVSAVEWLDLQAIKKGNMKNPQFLDNQYNKAKKYAEASLRNNNLVEAVRRYKRILRDFPENSHSSGTSKTLDSIMSSKDYSRAVRKRTNDRNREIGIRSSLESLLASHLENDPASDSSFLKISEEVKALKRMQKDHDAENRAMSSRILSYMSLSCYENGVNLYNIRKYNQASECFETGLLAEPGNIQMLLFRARSLALLDKNSESLSCLRKAVDLGYKDKQFLETNIAFAGMRENLRFRKLLDEMK